MSRKGPNGTSAIPVQYNLRWKCDRKTADQICNHNRRFAERSGYFINRLEFYNEVKQLKAGETITFYDSNTGKPLFAAPVGRTTQEFLEESRKHGWPSFRDDEVVWDNVRCLRGGEAVSLDGTHLGHNLPDANGSRYCINLVSVAGRLEGDPERRDGVNGGSKGGDVAEEENSNPKKKNWLRRKLLKMRRS